VGFWEDLDALREALTTAMGARGVTGAQFVPAFFGTFPRPFSVWLVTTTDAERDVLLADPALANAVSDVIAAALPALSEKCRGVTAQSEETLNRDYEGSWFYALR
jgi:hypothetical protein